MEQVRARWPRFWFWLVGRFRLDGFRLDGFRLGWRFVGVLVLVALDALTHLGQLGAHAVQLGARRVLVDQARLSLGETLVQSLEFAAKLYALVHRASRPSRSGESRGKGARQRLREV
jgi:hypothetical protein